jgi:Ca2+-binding RTX toxin-like protein
MKHNRLAQAAARAARPLTEALEPRKLLTVAFDAPTGVVTVTLGANDDIVQFEAQGDSVGVTGFRVITSQATTTLAGEAESDFDAYINAATADETSVFFDVPRIGEVPEAGDARVVVIRSGGGADLIIGGNNLPVPLDVDSGNGNDTISGGPRGDTIVAGIGDDYIFGGGGNDLITGNEGADRMLGGDGSDTADYRQRVNDVFVDLGSDGDDGELGENDNVARDIERVTSGSGNDRLTAANPGSYALSGGFGDDTLTGSFGDDTLNGGEGADVLIGNEGDDLILAADGTGTDFVDEGSGSDVVIGEVLSGNNDDVSVSAEDRFVRVTGEFSRPAPTINRGDRFDLDSDPDGVLIVSGSASDDRIFLSRFGTDDLIVEIESTGGGNFAGVFDRSEFTGVRVLGLGGDDLIAAESMTFNGDALGVSLDGGAGDDTLVGSAGGDVLAGGGRGIIVSADGTTVLETDDDFLLGFGGDDTLDGGYGADRFVGGDGFDSVVYSARTQPLVVGIGLLADDGERDEGDDVELGIEAIRGGSGDDDFSTISGDRVTFFGNGGDDTLTGGSGDDVFDGGAGNDVMVGNAGDDLFAAADGEIDTLTGGSGNDTAQADANDILDSVDRL